MLRYLLLAGAALLTAGCAVPLAPEVWEKVDPGLDFAAVQADPLRFQGKSLLLGGSIVTLHSDGQGSLLEILRWETNRAGEPLFLAEAGDHVLVRSGQPLDADLFTRGRLITLGVTVNGMTAVTINERNETVLLFDLLGSHLWETPFRYGLHLNPDPGEPEYITPRNPGPDHPYDPTPWAYPHSPYWYRNQ